MMFSMRVHSGQRKRRWEMRSNDCLRGSALNLHAANAVVGYWATVARMNGSIMTVSASPQWGPAQSAFRLIRILDLRAMETSNDKK